jgi:MYXO-CTERM domain-containing protein
MTPATAFLTYLWHYMAARFLYDEVVRRHVAGALLLAAVAVVGFGLRRRRRT